MAASLNGPPDENRTFPQGLTLNVIDMIDVTLKQWSIVTSAVWCRICLMDLPMKIEPFRKDFITPAIDGTTVRTVSK